MQSINNQRIGGGYFYWLDALRFVAAFMVLLSHTRNDFFLRYDLLPAEQQGVISMCFYSLCRLGHEAVMFFFVLSGFLVGGKGLENIMNHSFDIPKYTIDRAVRIGLPLIACIVFYFVTCLILGQQFDWMCAIGNLFSLQGIFCKSLVSPFWSLAFEVWFYVLLAIIALFFREGNSFKKLIYLLCVMLVFTKLKHVYLFMWFMGAFAYLCRPKNKSLLMFIFSLIGVFVSISFLQLSAGSMAMASYSLNLNREVVELLLGLFTCLLVQQLILMKPERQASQKVERAFHHLAAFSYTLYLSHRITLLLVFRYLYDINSNPFTFMSIMQYLSVLAICLTVAYLLYLPFERNTYKVKVYIKQNVLNNKILQ